MTRTTLTRLVLSAATAICAGCEAHFKPIPPTPMPPVVERRAKLENFATYAEHPEFLPGKVLLSVKKDGKCPSDRTYDADYMSADSYLTAGSTVASKTLNSLIYQGDVRRGADFDLAVATFGLNLGGAVAAEVIVTDVREAVGEGMLDLAKIQRLETTPLPPDVCARILVRNARVSLVHYKLYQSATDKLDFTGTAFGFGSEAYESSTQFQADSIVSLDIARLAAPGAAHALRADGRIVVRVPDGRSFIPTRDSY